MYDGGGFVSGWRRDRGVLVTRDTQLREILSGPGNVPPGTMLIRGVCRGNGRRVGSVFCKYHMLEMA